MKGKVVKMGAENAVDIANKYLAHSESKITKSYMDMNDVSGGAFSSYNKFDENLAASKEHAVIRLKSGQKINVEEDSLLYEKVRDHAKSNFLMIDAERFINPSEISEFMDIDRSIDYSTLDLEKETDDIDPDWKKHFYGENE